MLQVHKFVSNQKSIEKKEHVFWKMLFVNIENGVTLQFRKLIFQLGPEFFQLAPDTLDESA